MPKDEKIKVRLILPPFYRNLVITILALTLLLGAGFMYYTFGQAKIMIVPSAQKVTSENFIDIKETPAADEIESGKAIEGKLYAFDITDTFAVPSTGKKEISDNTIGSVTLVNNYSKDQKLIATTRLQSKDGVIIRIRDEVTVPAGKKVAVGVYPDKPESFKSLAPGHFIIPGLWAGVQDKIFGESTETLKIGGHTVAVATEADIKNVDKTLSDKIDAKILDELKAQLAEEKLFNSKLIQKDILEKTVDAKAGDQADLINVTVKVKAVVVVFDEIQLINTLRKTATATISAGKTLKDLDPKSIVYKVEKYDLDTKTANIKVYIEGKAVVKSDNSIFDKSKVYGLSKQEVIKYYKAFPEVESVTVEFFPSWVWRVPRSDDKVEIIISR